ATTWKKQSHPEKLQSCGEAEETPPGSDLRPRRHSRPCADIASKCVVYAARTGAQMHSDRLPGPEPARQHRRYWKQEALPVGLARHVLATAQLATARPLAGEG